ncbi:10574_t:CDS:2 [Ambispora leptoticha]|uniref:10574_t:CDS:1 n=1 Tax=Ambispora leptoticha TaxID=144679 RepID=A0A9N9AMW7_9GLOM|nr:10574_t:CDS:2 [Ambispora leptoticha]
MKNLLVPLTCLLISISILKVNAEETPNCTFKNDTISYDLSKLRKDSNEYYEVAVSEKKFALNVCEGLKDKSKDGASLITDDEWISLGKKNSTLYIQNDELFLNYKDGDKCPDDDNNKRETFIRFICDRTIEGQGAPKLLLSSRECVYIFEWKTSVACPESKTENMGGWGVFFTIFFIAFLVYFMGGIVYNRMVHNAVGFSQLPNWEFWRDAWDFVKDMFLILVSQCPSFGRRAPRNYRNLPVDEENILIGEEFEEH